MLQSMKLKGVGDLKSPLTSAMEMQNFGVCPAGFQSLVQYFLIMLPFLLFGMTIYILCHCMLEIYNLPFYFDFTEVTIERCP